MATKLSSNWTFVGQESAGTPSEAISVQEFPCLVGRGNEAQLRLPHPSISQRHADLTIENDFLVIRDIGSRNGTYVNGTRVSNPRQVMPGDLIQFGDRLYRLELRSCTQFCIKITVARSKRSIGPGRFYPGKNRLSLMHVHKEVLDLGDVLDLETNCWPKSYT